MKKFLLSSLALLFFAPLAHADFPDVSATSEYYQAVSALEDLGIVKGYPDGTFKLDQPVNRAEFLKMAYLAEAKHNPDRRYWEAPQLFPFGQESTIKVDPPCFSDLDGKQWFDAYVCWGKEKGLVKGYSNGEFRPEQEVIVAEAAKMLVETSGHTDVLEAEQEHWAEGYLHALGPQALPPSIQKADQVLTRGQVAELIWRYTLATKEELKGKTATVMVWNEEKYGAWRYLGSTYDYFYVTDELQVKLLGNSKLGFLPFTWADLASFKIYNYTVNYMSPQGEQKSQEITFAGDDFTIFQRGQDRMYAIIDGEMVTDAGGEFGVFEDSFFNLVDSEEVYGYGWDRKNVYFIRCEWRCQLQVIPYAEKETFEILSAGYSKTKDHVYFMDKRLIGVDATSFKRLAGPFPEKARCSFPFSRDKDHLFLEEKPVDEVDVHSVEFLHIDGFFLKDKNGIYHTLKDGKGPACSANEVVFMPQADPSSFRLLGDKYFLSKGVVYYFIGWGESMATKIDPDSFAGFVSVNEPDPEKRFILSNVVKDNQYVYYNGQPLPDLDLETFGYDEANKKWKDKNGTYGWLEINQMLGGN